jgi:putative DNA primase/helicase
MPLEAADGSWPRLLMELGALSPEQLTDTHQPCPNCGGTDRYRWDQDDGPGGWFCNGCGGKDHMGGGGNGMDLLMRVTGWEFKDACRKVEAHLGLPQPATAKPAPKSKGRPHRIPDRPPPDAAAPALGRAAGQWCYRNSAGEQLFWLQRLNQADGKKLFLQRTWLDGTWHYPSKRDTFKSEWPAPRPLYRLPDLTAKPDAPVLLAEGEKAADAAAELFPDHVCLAWCGGTGGINTVDWQALEGRDVTLWPDADKAGRQCAAKVAAKLLPIAGSVAVVTPPDSLPEGWDLADAEGWTHRQALNALRKFAKPVEPLPEPEPQSDPQPVQDRPTRVITDLPKYQPFTCLGFDDGVFYYQPHATGQVVSISRGSHTGTNLVNIAPLAYWEALYPSKTGVNWLAAASSLFEQQAKTGIFSNDRIRGRGAWWDAGRSVLHLGDRLLIDGVQHPITSAPSSKFHYQRLASIELPGHLEPLTDDEGLGLAHIASRFHWEVPASGLLLAGWIALAPICGALQWRPHIWLTASAGSGKSAILDRLIGPLIESLALFPEGTTTEAYIRQQLRADAVPVVFDEAESNEKADRQRIQSILALARVSSSSGRGVIGKGGADGTAQAYNIRSMFLLCSISTALKQGADQSRFAQLTLRNPSFMPKPERAAHWAQLDADITEHCTTEVGQRMMLRMVQQIPIIRDSVAVFRRAAAERFDSQRQGDQYGTLLAGAWSLTHSRPATIEDAYNMIDGSNWDAYKEQTEADEERCLQHILQHQLRVETEHVEVNGGKVFNRSIVLTRTIWELIEAAKGGSDSDEVSGDAAESHLGRIGLRVMDDRLMVANTALGLQRILADTPWAHSWPTVLARLPGAEKPGKVRFKSMRHNSRAVSLPLNFD